MAVVLGFSSIYDSVSVHELGASLVKDGIIVAAINEDRLSNQKHDGSQPFKSLYETLRIGICNGIMPGDIDAVAIPTTNYTADYFNRIKRNFFNPKQLLKSFFRFPIAKRNLDLMKVTLENFGITAPIHFVSHHRAHAALAYYCSGLKGATVVTIDGIGYDDNKTSTVNIAEGKELKELSASLGDKNSLGHFYAAATKKCGFKISDGEGKTTGLACYGNPEKCYGALKGEVSIEGLKIRGNYSLVNENKITVSAVDKKPFAPYKFLNFSTEGINAVAKKAEAKDLAAAAQRILEERACELVSNAVNATGNSNVCLGGGVPLNVKMNKKIRELDCVESVYIPPNPGDSGLDAGAALFVSHELKPSLKSVFLDNPYLGTEFSNQEIEETILDLGMGFERLQNPSSAAADYISEGKVVGWFQGALEWGPRALGNRSVLADPSVPGMRERINKFLKKRDWFMPFAPSMLDAKKSEYLVDSVYAPYMIMAFDVPKKTAKDIVSATHVDNTARPQTVKKKSNPKYWKLIREFEKNSGIPVVLNTSFNKHGQVIVRTPAEALTHLLWGCVEELIIGDYRAIKK